MFTARTLSARHSFGLVHVDYAGGSLNRTLKRASSAFFLELAATRKVPTVEPSSASPTTPPGVLALLLLSWWAWASATAH